MKSKKNWQIVLMCIAVAIFIKGCKKTDSEKKEQYRKPRTIHEAARDGNNAAIEKFIEKGVNVNKKDEIGMTPLHWAVSYGQKESAEILIKNGALINIKNKDYATPLGYTTRGGNKCKEIAELLIENGADVNERYIDGITPLHYAIINGQPDIAQLFITKGADVNAENKNGKTPLDCLKVMLNTKFRRGSFRAKQRKAFEACEKILREHGAK